MTDRDLPFSKRTFRLLRTAVDEFGKDMAGRFAAALAFYTLFSMVPLLFVLVAAVGFVSSNSDLLAEDCMSVTAANVDPESENPLDRLIAQIDTVAGAAVADPVASMVCRSASTASPALWIAIALAAFSGSAIFRQLQGILNFIFSVSTERTSGLVNNIVTWAVGVGSALILGVLVLVPFAAVAGVNFVSNLITVVWLRQLLTVVVPTTSLLLLVAVGTATYKWLPRRHIPARAAFVGGAFTSIVGLIGAFLVGAYLSSDFATGGALGAVGGVAILLFFFNLMWVIYLLGAEVTKVYLRRLETGSAALEPAPTVPAETLVGGMPPKAESPLRTGVVAFFIGLFTGWAARKRP